MIWNTPYVLLLNISLMVSLVFMAIAVRYRHTLGAVPFAWLMVCALVWSAGCTLEVVSSDFKSKFFWHNVKQAGVYASPLAWLALALHCSGKPRWLKGNVLIAASILPGLAVILMWTNDLHHLMYLDMVLETSGQISAVKTVRTPLSVLFILYLYLLLILSLCLFAAAVKRSPSPYREQYVIFIVSLVMPMIATAADLFGLNPFAPFDPAPAVFILCGLLIGWGLYRFHLFHAWPIARDQLFDEMHVGIITTDLFNRVSDVNPAAQKILEKICGDLRQTPALGQPVSRLLTAHDEWSRAYADRNGQHLLEIMLDCEKCYEIKIQPLKNRQGAFIGHLTIIHNITERKKMEKELQIQATTDYLTGIYNRRHFMLLSEQQFSLAVRYQKPISLMIIDIDHFKQVNDSFGHSAGDQVLIQFARVCKSVLRGTDILGRMGGEEFIVTLPETTLDNARFVGEKIRAVVEHKVFSIDANQLISLTVSIGVASRVERDNSLDCLIQRADDLLYQAKQYRNHVQVQSL